jgi:hypothetical protein
LHQNGTVCPKIQERQIPIMTKVKKSAEGAGAENLDILAAKLQVVEVEFFPEPYTVDLDNGRSFESDPNVNCRIKVVKNLVDPGKDEGEQFFDRFKLKKDKDGDWIFSKYSKLGSLIQVLYGEDWFDDPDAEFNEEDVVNFEFIAQVKPKQDRSGKTIPGSTIQWDSMRPAGGADEREPAPDTEDTQPAEEDDFEIEPAF